MEKKKMKEEEEEMKGRALPFIRRYVAGTVFIGLGVVAATASVGQPTKA